MAKIKLLQRCLNILLAAKDVFAREGFSQAGMEQVARNAGVSTATLYAHFPSKAELFRVVVEATIEDHAVAVQRSTLAGGSPHARLEAFATAYAEFYFTDVNWPDFTPACFVDAMVDFAGRDRRFGGLTNK